MGYNSAPGDVDVLIVGGGPGGLSAALALARQLHTAIVFDDGNYRNYTTKHMHNVVTWDHKSPADFRTAARADIAARYDTIHFRDTRVEKIVRIDDSFRVEDSTGASFIGRKVVLAQGRRDVFPDIKGYKDCWGTSIFHCLFCHGYEERGTDTAGVLALGLLADTESMLHVARMAAPLAKQITIYTHGDPKVTASAREALDGKPPRIESRIITALENLPGRGLKVHFDDGDSRVETFLSHEADTRLVTSLCDQLNIKTEDQWGHPCIKVKEPFHETSIPGCYAVGDNSTAMTSVTKAMDMGAMCAAALSPQLGALKRF